jgi:hypothetical protein
MKLDKKDINVFLALWIKSDPELWGELRDIQIKLLLQRIVKEWTFKQMAEHYQVDEIKIRLIFEIILNKIEFSLGKEVANQLRLINRRLGKKNTLKIESDFNQVFLN